MSAGLILPLLLASSMFCASGASAHIILTSHQARHGSSEIKTGPCGKQDSQRGETVYTYKAGETITIEWDEFVPHPGYFRISFDEDDDDDFVTPWGYSDYYSNHTVMADGLFPHGVAAEGSHEAAAKSTIHSIEITLPNVSCDNCTMQVMQMMTEFPYNPDLALYYNCLDLVLLPEPGHSLAQSAVVALLAVMVGARRLMESPTTQ